MNSIIKSPITRIPNCIFGGSCAPCNSNKTTWSEKRPLHLLHSSEVSSNPVSDLRCKIPAGSTKMLCFWYCFFRILDAWSWNLPWKPVCFAIFEGKIQNLWSKCNPKCWISSLHGIFYCQLRWWTSVEREERPESSQQKPLKPLKRCPWTQKERTFHLPPQKKTKIRCYCWWMKSCPTWDVQNPINNGIIYNLSSLVVQDFVHQQ